MDPSDMGDVKDLLTLASEVCAGPALLWVLIQLTLIKRRLASLPCVKGPTDGTDCSSGRKSVRADFGARRQLDDTVP